MVSAIPESQSFRQEQDNKNANVWRYSVIFAWQGKKGEDPYPNELRLTIGRDSKIYRLVEE